jgi:hypothetical protein
MRFSLLLTSTLTLIPALAFAQTLDGQMNKMQARKPITAPVAAPQVAPATQPMSIMAPANRIDSIGGGAIPFLPLEVKTENGITYVNGGIGDEEMDQLKSRESSYNFRVSLSAAKGEYISDVVLNLLDAKGAPLVTVLDAGPYFYAQLKPGNYILETTSKSDGKARSVKFTISAKGTVIKHVVYAQ